MFMIRLDCLNDWKIIFYFVQFWIVYKLKTICLSKFNLWICVVVWIQENWCQMWNHWNKSCQILNQLHDFHLNGFYQWLDLFPKEKSRRYSRNQGWLKLSLNIIFKLTLNKPVGQPGQLILKNFPQSKTIWLKVKCHFAYL